MTFETASKLGTLVVSQLSPVCERCEIAGSVRRCKSDDIKDLEVVCIPRTRDIRTFKQIIDRWQKNKGEATGKYTQRYVQGQKVDIFITSIHCWPAIFLLRTGDAAFSQAVVTHAHSCNMRFQDGRLWHTDGNGTLTKLVDGIDSEAAIFSVLGLRWVEPKDRNGRWMIRRV